MSIVDVLPNEAPNGLLPPPAVVVEIFRNPVGGPNQQRGGHHQVLAIEPSTGEAALNTCSIVLPPVFGIPKEDQHLGGMRPGMPDVRGSSRIICERSYDTRVS